MPIGLKLNEIKTNINNVIANLDLLDGLSSAPLEHFDVTRANQLEQRTTELLSQLEQIPCGRITRTQQLRKRRRLRDKQKYKLQKTINKSIAKKSESKTNCSKTLTEPTSRQCAPEQGHHITLKKRHDASNLLHTFDLLERLYKARGGDKDLGKRLDRVRAVWQRVQQESQSSTASENYINLETQWNQVFFGSTAEPTANCRGHKKQNTQDLLQCRNIWDSFISYGNNSSSIPIGWVLPPKDPMPDWTKYREK